MISIHFLIFVGPQACIGAKTTKIKMFEYLLKELFIASIQLLLLIAP